jgi:hypothetical protein
VFNDHNFSQVTLLSLLVLSRSGRGVGWLIYYIASSAVAFYPDYFTSPSFPFTPLSPSCHYSHLSLLTLPVRFATVGSYWRLDRRISLALLSHTTPEEYERRTGYRPSHNWVRVLSYYTLEAHDTSTPGSKQALGAEGAVMDSLARCYRTSRPSERSLNSALSRSRSSSSQQG